MVVFEKENIWKDTGVYVAWRLFTLCFISGNRNFNIQKSIRKERDYYGEYIIDRDFFPGKQADWQYENFRFEIKDDDQIYFFVTDKDKIVKTFIGEISTSAPYGSERLIVNMEQPTIHIMKTNPTIYRKAWSFYLVFHSDKFNNMYFKKGTWKPIND